MARQSITGILYALVRADYYDTKTLLYAYVVSGICSALVLGLVQLAKGRKQMYGFLFGISLLQMVSAFEASQNLTIPMDSKKENAQFIDQVRRLAYEKGEEEIFYLYQGKSKLLYPVQYFLQDISLHLVSEEELWETGRAVFLIIPRGYEGRRGIPEEYGYIADSPSYELYYRGFDYNPG